MSFFRPPDIVVYRCVSFFDHLFRNNIWPEGIVRSKHISVDSIFGRTKHCDNALADQLANAHAMKRLSPNDLNCALLDRHVIGGPSR